MVGLGVATGYAATKVSDLASTNVPRNNFLIALSRW
jgi:hypothetical protein